MLTLYKYSKIHKYSKLQSDVIGQTEYHSGLDPAQRLQSPVLKQAIPKALVQAWCYSRRGPYLHEYSNIHICKCMPVCYGYTSI